jgi:hypothetical protein
MARSSQGSRSTTAWEPPKPASPHVVRLGRPANDNALRLPAGLRVVGVAACAAIVVYGLNWLGVI